MMMVNDDEARAMHRAIHLAGMRPPPDGSSVGVSIGDAMKIAGNALLAIRAATRWRLPRQEDVESGRVFDVIWATRGAEKWIGPIRTKLSDDLSVPRNPRIEVMIADPLPLPELPKVTP